VKLLIRGGKVVTATESYEASVLVEDGRIAEIGRGLTPPPDADTYDAGGKLILPGAIDAHVHVGLELHGHRSSGFEATTRTAAFGGVTTFLTYVHPERGETLADAAAARREEGRGRSYVDFGLHIALTNWEDRADEEIIAMIDAGMPSFKMYTVYSASGLKSDEEHFYRAFLVAGQNGGIVEAHCENEWMIENRIRSFAAEGKLTPADHAATRPSYAEGEAAAAVARAAYDAGAPVYIVHVSTGEALQVIAEARDIGTEVYAETCPHFLLLDDERLEGDDGALFATCPPLRAEAHQAMLWEALEEDEIGVIATDHCEFTAAAKRAGAGDFRRLPMGVPGVGTLLPLMWEHGVTQGRMSENDLVDRLSTRPAEIFGLYPRKGTLAPGSDADLVIFDPARPTTIHPEMLHGHADYSPYDGWEVAGWPFSTMVRGRWVVRDGELVGSPEHGGFVPRSRVCQSPGTR